MSQEASPALVCRLCQRSAAWRGRQRLLRYDVALYQCPHCDLLQTEQPYWIAEAYSEAISALDTGALQRNQVCVGVVLAAARLMGVSPSARCLDWGGGHGVFVRMMRDRGFDFHWRDEYARNLYALGFEQVPDQRYALITSFEVFEHFVDVRSELARIFALEPTFLLVGTRLHEGYRDEWWYYAHDTGQHVAFYSRKTMQFIAAEFGYRAVAGPAYTAFVRDRALHPLRRRMLQGLLDHAELGYALTTLFPEALRLTSKLSRTHPDYVALSEARGALHAISASGTTPESAATKPQAAT